MFTVFIWACCVLFILLSLIWSHNDIHNFMIKAVLIGMAICSVVVLLDTRKDNPEYVKIVESGK